MSGGAALLIAPATPHPTHPPQRFFCRGYLVGGPNWKASLGTAALVVMPAGIYIAFVGVYLAQEVHAIILVIRCGALHTVHPPGASTTCRSPANVDLHPRPWPGRRGAFEGRRLQFP